MPFELMIYPKNNFFLSFLLIHLLFVQFSLSNELSCKCLHLKHLVLRIKIRLECKDTYKKLNNHLFGLKMKNENV